MLGVLDSAGRRQPPTGLEQRPSQQTQRELDGDGSVVVADVHHAAGVGEQHVEACVLGDGHLGAQRGPPRAT